VYAKEIGKMMRMRTMNLLQVQRKKKKRRKRRKARLRNLKRRQRNLPGPVVEKGKERRQKMALNKRMIAQGHPASPKGKVVCL
jgi:hypothetical protein